MLPSMSSRSLIVPLLLGALTIGGCDKQSQPAAQENSSTAPISDKVPGAPQNAGPPATPTPAALVDRSHQGEPAPTLGFVDPQGKQVTLASFQGKPVLVNLWATWCAPCVAEMPTIDTLATAQKGKITVLTISQDLEGSSKVLPFFARGKYRTIQPYIDAEAAFSIALQANLPTTILYDATGHEMWRVSGGMDWTGKQAAGLLAKAS